MWAVIATVGTVATVFAVCRNPDTARIAWADAIEVMLGTTHRGCRTIDTGHGYTTFFNGREIVATVKIEECPVY